MVTPTPRVALRVRARLQGTAATARWFGRERIVVLGDDSVVLVEARVGRASRERALPALEAISMAVSPDGERVAVGGLLGKVVILDASLEVVAEVQLDRAVDDICFSADGTTLALAAGRVVALYDRDGTRRFSTELRNAATAVALVSGRLAASSSAGVQLWDASHGTPVRTYPSAYPLLSLSFSPEKRFMACGAGTVGGATASVWELARGVEFVLRGYDTKPRSLAWGVGEKLLATSGGPGLVLWTLEGEPVPELRRAHHRAPVGHVASARQRDLMASAGVDGKIAVWAPQGETEPVGMLELDAEPTSIEFAPDDSELLITDARGELALFQLP